jgi:hypothetical protein
VLAGLAGMKPRREMERRLPAVLRGMGTNPQSAMLPDPLTASSRVCLPRYRVEEKTVLTRLPRLDARLKENHSNPAPGNP